MLNAELVQVNTDGRGWQERRVVLTKHEMLFFKPGGLAACLCIPRLTERMRRGCETLTHSMPSHKRAGLPNIIDIVPLKDILSVYRGTHGAIRKEQIRRERVKLGELSTPMTAHKE